MRVLEERFLQLSFGIFFDLFAQQRPHLGDHGQNDKEERDGPCEEDAEAAAGQKQRAAEVALEHGSEDQRQHDGGNGDVQIDEEVADQRDHQHGPYAEEVVAQGEGADDAQRENDGCEGIGLDLDDLEEDAQEQQTKDQEQEVRNQDAGKDVVDDLKVFLEQQGTGLQTVQSQSADEHGGGGVARDAQRQHRDECARGIAVIASLRGGNHITYPGMPDSKAPGLRGLRGTGEPT